MPCPAACWYFLFSVVLRETWVISMNLGEKSIYSCEQQGNKPHVYFSSVFLPLTGARVYLQEKWKADLQCLTHWKQHVWGFGIVKLLPELFQGAAGGTMPSPSLLSLSSTRHRWWECCLKSGFFTQCAKSNQHTESGYLFYSSFAQKRVLGNNSQR